jgi:hypothetical protein
MSPPVFGKKPSIKRTDSSKEETTNEYQNPPRTVKSDSDSSIKLPPVEQTSDMAEADQAHYSFPERQNSASSSILSAESASSSPARTPSSMPVPAGPRRAAPPRKKAVKSSSPFLETDAQESPETVSAGTQDHDGEIQRMHEGNEESVTEPSVGAELPDDTQPKVAEEAEHVTEELQRVDILKFEESHAGANPGDTIKERPQEASLGGTGASQTSPDLAPVIPEAAEALTAEPEEEDEAVRRKRVAERLEKMGAFNPFSAPRRQSSIMQEGPLGLGDPSSPSDSPDIPRRGSLRKESVDSVASKSHGPEMAKLRKSSLDFDVDRPIIPPPPPRAEDLRLSSVDSTYSSPPLPIAPESPAHDITEYNVSKEEDESQDGEY